MLLVGDIGGTNVRVDFFEDDGKTPADHPARDNKTGVKLPMVYPDMPVLDALGQAAEDFDGLWGDVTRAAFGIAGKVTLDNGVQRVAMANRPEEQISSAAIGDLLPGENRTPVFLANDMAAHIASVDVAPAVTLQAGKVEPGGTRAILMPGTGCGVGFSVKHGDGYKPVPSEGGHFELPARTGEQERLLRRLRELLPAERSHYRVTYESVLSGQGLENMYGCLMSRRTPRLAAGVTPKMITMAAGGDPTHADKHASADACRLFTEFLGQYAGNLGVLLLPTAGMFLGGNIASVVRDIDRPAFDDRVVRAFLGAGSPLHRGILADMPLKLLEPTDTGLLGAAQIAAGL